MAVHAFKVFGFLVGYEDLFVLEFSVAVPTNVVGVKDLQMEITNTKASWTMSPFSSLSSVSGGSAKDSLCDGPMSKSTGRLVWLILH